MLTDVLFGTSRSATDAAEIVSGVAVMLDHDRLQQKDILIQFGVLRKLLLSYDLLRIIPNWYLFPVGESPLIWK